MSTEQGPAAAANTLRRFALPLLVLSAFTLRLLVVLLLPDQSAQLPDAIAYRHAAEHLKQSLQLGTPVFMPLYPLLLTFTGGGVGQLLLDVTLSTLLVYLIHQLAMTLFRDVRVALLAALIAAIYPHFIFFAAVGLTETLFMTLTVAAYLCWYRRLFAWAAVLIVLSILTRPAIELLVPVLVLWFAVGVHRLSLRVAARKLAALGTIYVALMSPWWLHNYMAYGSFVRLNLGAGLALYSGNNPWHRGGGGDFNVDAHAAAVASTDDPVLRDRLLREAAVAHIFSDPREFLAQAGRKFLRFWRLWPFTETYSSLPYVLASGLSFGSVLTLSIFYLVGWGFRDFRQTASILLLIGYLTAVHMIVPASLRYRLPLEPFLIVLAAGGLVRLGEQLSRRGQTTCLAE